jgi:excisionase family DNA binding protein
MNSRTAANVTVPLLTPAEVAAAFRVDPKTVTRWAKCGKLSYIRTLGGHRRFLATEVHDILQDVPDSERANPFLPWNAGSFHGQ